MTQMQKKKYFPATDVISLHLCDQGVQEGAGGESRMLQRPTKRFISYSALAHLLVVCTSLWCIGAYSCGEIILHEFTHNQSSHGSDAALVVQPFAMWGLYEGGWG